LSGAALLLWLSVSAAPPSVDEPPAPRDSQEVEPYRRKLDAILARPEFRVTSRAPGVVEPRVETPSFLRWAFDGIGRLWDRFWEWVFEKLLRSPPSLPRGARPGLSAFPPAAWALLAGAAALLAILVVRIRRSRAPETAETPPAPASAGAADEPDALSQSTEAWARFAEAFARRGEWRLALRAAYLELLNLLHHRGAIHYEKQRTNGEYVAELARGPAVESFSLLTLLFDETWYGLRPFDAAGYSRALAFARAVDRATAPPPEAAP
jgi:hypothetical protein